MKCLCAFSEISVTYVYSLILLFNHLFSLYFYKTAFTRDGGSQDWIYTAVTMNSRVRGRGSCGVGYEREDPGSTYCRRTENHVLL